MEMRPPINSWKIEALVRKGRTVPPSPDQSHGCLCSVGLPISEEDHFSKDVKPVIWEVTFVGTVVFFVLFKVQGKPTMRSEFDGYHACRGGKMFSWKKIAFNRLPCDFLTQKHTVAAFMLQIALRRCLSPRKALCQKAFNLEAYWKGLRSDLIWYCSEGERYRNVYRNCIPYIVTGQSFWIVTGVPSEP